MREARLLFTPTFSQCLSNKGHDSFQKGLMTFFWVLAVAPFLPSLSLCCAVLCLDTQSCPTVCDLTDCSPPGSSVHGDLQARILEPRGSYTVILLHTAHIFVNDLFVIIPSLLSSTPCWDLTDSYTFLLSSQFS